jgi:hypothetical protein
LSKRLWLYSVLTKVMWKPLKWSSFASFSIGFMWPWAGKGIHTAWGLFANSMDTISPITHKKIGCWGRRERRAPSYR